MNINYNNKLALHYDRIYSDKDYEAECQMIMRSAGHGDELRLLDVGAGTCSHTVILSKYFKEITAVDLSYSMLQIGKQKLINADITNVSTYCKSIESLNLESKFDVCISMFNVVNHIQTIKELQQFFKAISNALKPGGIFIFDCWNGLACHIEKPKQITSKIIKSDEYEFRNLTTTETNLMYDISKMHTTTNIYRNGDLLDMFSYDITVRTWAPSLLSELLSEVDLPPIKIVSSNDEYRQATDTDRRLTFACEKE